MFCHQTKEVWVNWYMNLVQECIADSFRRALSWETPQLYIGCSHYMPPIVFVPWMSSLESPHEEKGIKSTMWLCVYLKAVFFHSYSPPIRLPHWYGHLPIWSWALTKKRRLIGFLSGALQGSCSPKRLLWWLCSDEIVLQPICPLSSLFDWMDGL